MRYLVLYFGCTSNSPRNRATLAADDTTESGIECRAGLHQRRAGDGVAGLCVILYGLAVADLMGGWAAP